MSAIHLEWNPVEQQLESLQVLVEELLREVGEVRAENAELRCDVGYWKSRHADAVERNTKLQAELDAAKAEFDNSKLNNSARNLKSNQPAIVRIGSMIQTSRQPRRRSEGDSREVRHRSVEITHSSRSSKNFVSFGVSLECLAW